MNLLSDKEEANFRYTDPRPHLCAAHIIDQDARTHTHTQHEMTIFVTVTL